MYIEGRKNKPYSEALYNELLLLNMLISAVNDLPSYILNETFHKSGRTYRRYFRELHDCGLIPEIVFRRSRHLHDEFTCYIPVNKDTGQPFEDADRLLQYLDLYSREHFNPASRLYRCGRIIISSSEQCYCYDDCFLKDDDSDLNLPNTYHVGELYCHVELSGYAELYEGLSLRSRQRDLKLVKRTVLDALLLSDKFA